MTMHNGGHIRVISGCMFSGKTSRLLWFLKRAKIGERSVVLFKPALDERYSKTEVVTHDNISLPCLVVSDINDIYEKGKDFEVIGIDEIQFMDSKTLLKVCNQLADMGKSVIAAGLDLDAQDEAFEATKELLGVAEYVEKLVAVCPDCNRELATKTYRKSQSKAKFEVGGKDSYDPLCRECNLKRKSASKS